MPTQLTVNDYVVPETKEAFDKFFASTTLDEIDFREFSMETFKRALLLCYNQGRSDRFEDLNTKYYFSRKGEL